MATVLDHPALPSNVKSKLQKRIAELGGQISDGYAQDWADYQLRVGVLRGLSEAIDLCDKTEQELNR